MRNLDGSNFFAQATWASHDLNLGAACRFAEPCVLKSNPLQSPPSPQTTSLPLVNAVAPISSKKKKEYVPSNYSSINISFLLGLFKGVADLCPYRQTFDLNIIRNTSRLREDKKIHFLQLIIDHNLHARSRPYPVRLVSFFYHPVHL